MWLKIHTVHGLIFDGEIEKVEFPSKVGILCILPHHNPLVSIVTPWLVKFVPAEKKGNKTISNSEFLFDDEKIAIAVGEGSMYTDGKDVVMFVASATVTPKSDEETLQHMKKDLEEKIRSIRASWNTEDIEKAYLNLQKLTADIKLLDIKKHTHKDQDSF